MTTILRFIKISINVLLLKYFITVHKLCMRKKEVFDIYIEDLILSATCLQVLWRGFQLVIMIIFVL